MTQKAEPINEAAFVDDFLQSEFKEEVADGNLLVIEEKLSIGELLLLEGRQAFLDKLQTQVKKEDRILAEAVRDFCTKNAGDDHLDSLDRLSVSHMSLPQQKMEAMFDHDKNQNQDGWKVFYKTYPNASGIITLSRVGFSKDGTLAVIYMGRQSGWLNGGGGIRVYEKVNGQWVRAYGKLLGPSWVS